MPAVSLAGDPPTAEVLRIDRLTDGRLSVCRLGITGFVIQSASRPGEGADWTDVTDQRSYQFTPSPGSRFFRAKSIF